MLFKNTVHLNGYFYNGKVLKKWTDGKYETDDPVEAEYIKSHIKYVTAVNETEAKVEVVVDTAKSFIQLPPFEETGVREMTEIAKKYSVEGYTGKNKEELYKFLSETLI